MSTKWISVKGVVKWAKVYEPDVFSGASNWKVSFCPLDATEKKKITDSGMQLSYKMDESDGLEYIRLRRPDKKLFKDEVTFFAPPEVSGKVTVQYQDENGDRIRQYKKGDKVNRVGEPVEIGNGSTVIANICVYDTVKGKGHRLEGLTVLDLVEYKREEGNGEGERTRTGEHKIKTETKEVKKSLKEDLNDEIPFGGSSDDKLPW
ncbi:hypothetical protein EVB99_059 [Rhizobium phage RHph_N3_19]|nr:hypothetical protein EVB99_059 [Rhizobium phage RHph_N3_19]